MSCSNEVTSPTDPVHPMDVQMAVFHCADGFLKQLMVTKLSQCQYALPLLVPDPFTQEIDFPLWTFRQISKSWMSDTHISQTHLVYKAQTPMVSFFRFGTVSSSKSQLMNSLINEKHNTFFHRNCPGSSKTRVLMDGVVEIAWFCPSGTCDNKFTDCVAFCNLHGNAEDHEKQLQILTEMASVNVVLLPQIHRNDKSTTIMQSLYKNRKPLICIFTEDVSTLSETRKGKFKIGLKDRNQSDVSEELRKAIDSCLLPTGSSSTFRLEDVSKHSDIRVDEDDDDDCRKGKEAAQQMMSLLKKVDLTEIKESLLPHQGKLWHQWCQKNKELHRPQADDIEKELTHHEGDRLAAEMMISGFPLELMDGDVAYVPQDWISAVLDELIKTLGNQRVFVLTGKSTMLNAMFGLQFARSCHASDQSVNFDYILVVDTEGLRALEPARRSTRHHDNELATFVVGLANLTLINIYGESPAEMQDILQSVVQAFLRMKKNVSDITAKEKNMEGRRQLQETLDEITKLTAEEE
ncbi:hypothetical protein M9458_048879, partial [Cirrhinus mrigala]